MKKDWPLALVVIGAAIVLTGFVYDVLFAGIPYQDPTPELTANYHMHSQIAVVIRCLGMSICLAGGGVFIALGITRKLREPRI